MKVVLLLQRVLDLLKILLTGNILKELSEIRSKISAQNLPRAPFPVGEEQNTKISVVIPTLNEASYIKNPLVSLNGSHHRNFDVIVVDCMSDDDTAAKARRHGANVILSQKRNAGHQTHLGFMSAKGDIIVRTDADTIFPQDILTKTAHAFQNKRIALYHVGHLYYDGNILLNLLAHLYDKYWRKIWGTTGHFIAVRKRTYREAPFRPLARGQDYDFGKRVHAIFGPRAIAYDPSTTVFISSRAIRKRGLLRHILSQGSFRPRPPRPDPNRSKRA